MHCKTSGLWFLTWSHCCLFYSIGCFIASFYFVSFYRFFYTPVCPFSVEVLLLLLLQQSNFPPRINTISLLVFPLKCLPTDTDIWSGSYFPLIASQLALHWSKSLLFPKIVLCQTEKSSFQIKTPANMDKLWCNICAI